MERKAWENLAAARVLLDVEEPCPNAAASRAYYAAYHACWHAMNEVGIPTPEVRSGVYYFLHEPLPYEARRTGVLDDWTSQELFDLRELRIAADYLEEDVTVEDAWEALKAATVIVRHVLGEEPTW
ncbi:HEPN domain-containing protein [Archangium violaceum]|uniref:HEPN domain-containing protein n=1 Tax=Archangium violaceum TaxID=83451 RepID=UPI00193C3C01|nr:HEPN domain-containing protein [Archangium violaceum]QRK05784.1 HEPN domain-containing protein [Archangium violaceum]